MVSAFHLVLNLACHKPVKPLKPFIDTNCCSACSCTQKVLGCTIVLFTNFFPEGIVSFRLVAGKKKKREREKERGKERERERERLRKPPP